MSDLLNSASLVMIPSGYKEDVVYSQIPTDGSGDLSFTRASNGTRINSAGLVEVCPWNLCTYSEQFTNAAWLGGGNGKPTMTDNFAEAPNGTMTASKMEAASDGYQLRQNNAQENTQMNLSVWLRTNTGTKTIQLFLNNASTASQNITVTTTWTRYEINGLVTSLAGSGRNGLNTLEALTSSAYILVWGFQLSVSTTAKPYFPTTDRLNVPRLTYQNGGGGCPSLLLEKQSTNLLTYSEELDNAAWNKILISATANNTSSPDGTQNADLITTTSAGVCYTYELITGTSGAYSASIYAKNGNNNYLALNIQNSLNNWVTSVFDLSDGSLGEYAQGSGGGIVYASHTITSVGNGWYRCVLNYTTNQNSYYCPMFAPLKTGNSFTSAYGEAQSNANNKTLYLWGAQLETSSYPTSYIPTTSSSATRVADACSKTGISSLIGQTEGTLFAQFNKPIDSIYPFRLNLSDGTANNWVFIGFEGLIFRGYIRASNSVILSNGFSGTANVNKIAIAYKSGDYAIYHNGTQIATGSSSFSFNGTLSQINVAENPTDVNYAVGEIAEIFVSKTRLTNAELASLTTI